MKTRLDGDARTQRGRPVVIGLPADRTAPAPGRTVLAVSDDGLLDFLRGRTTGPAAQAGPVPATDADDLLEADLDDELVDRLQAMYFRALPDRLAAISSSTSAGDTSAVAFAAHTLAGTSGQLGHPEVASICQEIAADARRGVLAHSRVARLQELAAAC